MTRKHWVVGVYAVSHFLVDFACAYLIYAEFLRPQSGEFISFRMYAACLLIYNFFAFAMQCPFGLLADRFNHNSWVAASGCLLVGLAFFFCWNRIVAFILVGIGNGLFHIGGGIDVLNLSDGKCAPLGVFVSPGAFGIYLGTRLGRQAELMIPLLLVALLVAMAVILLTQWETSHSWNSANKPFGLRFPNRKVGFVAFLLFCVVILRSFGGLMMNFPWKDGGNWGLIFIIAVVSGKTVGGFAADRFGLKKSAILSLSLAAVCFLFAEQPIFGITSVFSFNMTMPMTLLAMARLFPNAMGFSFGLLTLALFVGFLPSVLDSLIIFLPLWIFSVICIVSLVLFLCSLQEDLQIELQ